MNKNDPFEWDDKAVSVFVKDAALLVHGVAYDVWSHAKRNHKWKNDTGELEKSIRIDKIRADKKLVHFRVAMGIGESIGINENQAGYGKSDEAYYALYLELGTKKMRPYPCLLPALKQAKARSGLKFQTMRLSQIVGRMKYGEPAGGK